MKFPGSPVILAITTAPCNVGVGGILSTSAVSAVII